MNKKIIAVLLSASLLTSMTACGGGKDSTESTTTTLSVDFDIDYAKQVTKLCDYSSIPVEISSGYEITNDAINEYFASIVNSYGGNGYHEITDRTTVQEGDYVNVDYTGYKDGEAFEGGAATGVLIDVSGNCAVAGSGYIDGFTAGIIGNNVGDTVECDVTFPEQYQSEELAGQAVVFKFVINGIYDSVPLGIDEVDDKFVEDLFGAKLGVTTVDSLKEAINQELEQNKKSATSEAIVKYIVENSTIDVPDDYLDARVEAYANYFASTYVTDGSSLDDYLKNNYNTSEADAKKSWRSSLLEQAKEEFVLGYIAELEGIEVDETVYSEYVTNYVSYNNMTSEDQLFEYAGMGDVEAGKKDIRNRYIQNLALDKIAENAQITFAD